MSAFVAGIVCTLINGCGPQFGYAPPQPPTNPNVIVYYDRGPMVNQAVQAVDFEQIARIGLDCRKKDTIISFIESRVGNQPRHPEHLTDHDRRINAIARSKIWLLRTNCY
jgi:hypothetical protein